MFDKRATIKLSFIGAILVRVFSTFVCACVLLRNKDKQTLVLKPYPLMPFYYDAQVISLLTSTHLLQPRVVECVSMLMSNVDTYISKDTWFEKKDPVFGLAPR